MYSSPPRPRLQRATASAASEGGTSASEEASRRPQEITGLRADPQTGGSPRSLPAQVDGSCVSAWGDCSYTEEKG